MTSVSKGMPDMRLPKRMSIPLLGTLAGHLVIGVGTGLILLALFVMVDGVLVRTGRPLLHISWYITLLQGVVVYVLIAVIAEVIRSRKERS